MNRRTLLHAVIGVIVSLVGTPLLGGGVTAYLEGPDLKTGGTFGLLIGGVSGALHAVWMLYFGFLDVSPAFRPGVDGLLF